MTGVQTCALPISRCPPLLLLAGSLDQQCPPEAVRRTVDFLAPTYTDVLMQEFGRRAGQHDDYGHFDLLIGTRADAEVFPAIEHFLLRHDEPLPPASHSPPPPHATRASPPAGAAPSPHVHVADTDPHLSTLAADASLGLRAELLIP